MPLPAVNDISDIVDLNYYPSISIKGFERYELWSEARKLKVISMKNHQIDSLKAFDISQCYNNKNVHLMNSCHKITFSNAFRSQYVDHSISYELLNPTTDFRFTITQHTNTIGRSPITRHKKTWVHPMHPLGEKTVRNGTIREDWNYWILF